jgi:hypothetical protein
LNFSWILLGIEIRTYAAVPANYLLLVPGQMHAS